MGERIVELVPSGDVALFIATPGALNIQPRIDGATQAIKAVGQADQRRRRSRPARTWPTELSMIDAYYQGHKDLKGMFAVDAGEHAGRGAGDPEVQAAGEGIHGGGYDLLPTTLEADQEGLPRVHDRPAALPAGLLPGGAAVPVQALRRADGALRHEHRPAVRDEGQRQAVPRRRRPATKEARARRSTRSTSSNDVEASQQSTRSIAPERRASLGWRVLGAFAAGARRASSSSRSA